MTVNPLITVGLLALAYGTALVCKRYGWFARWNFVVLMLAAWIVEIFIFALGTVALVLLLKP